MKEDKSKEITLDEINMDYLIDVDFAWEDGEAVLKCSRTWTIERLAEWLPAFGYDALASVKDWLASEAHIAEGMCLRVWI